MTNRDFDSRRCLTRKLDAEGSVQARPSLPAADVERIGVVLEFRGDAMDSDAGFPAHAAGMGVFHIRGGDTDVMESCTEIMGEQGGKVAEGFHDGGMFAHNTDGDLYGDSSLGGGMHSRINERVTKATFALTRSSPPRQHRICGLHTCQTRVRLRLMLTASWFYTKRGLMGFVSRVSGLNS